MVTVQTQPTGNVWDFENEWSTAVCGCCYDVGVCCRAHWCFPCFMCQLHARTNECLCTGCLPGGNTGLRTKIRTGFRIRGGVGGDAFIMCFFPCCGAIQMYNELEFQGL
ncbi:unnamed protein product [Adineta steineri]|uniref:Cornifelin-like protein n=1 Tax=Adineta steineri TaxID=433720 RepID=A0A815JLY6_9BILA|nr:unnamed protein product [Adineta steineri]CAF1163697.1 unnamed protein product [Adineta steineri]CAF1236214.1 unnamed protein product [Adineta steineri]CAF1250580.1 unnamed protein product [Adineta steineri]CAF1384025.1 unnamed protein product [Adineta steineri]